MLAHTRVLQLDVQGSFDFYTTVVSLDALDSDAVEAMRQEHAAVTAREAKLTSEQFRQANHVLPLIAHELTHFVDATSTTWGFRHLRLLAAAHRAAEAAEETEFHHYKSLYDHMRSLRLPAYYTVQGPAMHANRPWRSSVTVGRRFDSRGRVDTTTSISFSRFENADGQLLVRSPLSLVSILETSAMAQETLLRAGLLGLLEPDVRAVERALLTKQVLDYLYNRDVTEYSVCAHIVANRLRCSDVIAAFAVAGVVSRWVLNFPLQGFAAVVNRAPIERLLGVEDGHPYAAALRDGLRGQDLGSLFFLLTRALPNDAHEHLGNLSRVIERASTSLGVDNAQLEEWRGNEIQQNARQIAEGSSNVLRRIAVAGIANHARSRAQDVLLDMTSFDLPYAVFGDGRAGYVGGRRVGTLSGLTPDHCFEDLFPVEVAVNNFSEACL